MKVGKRVRLGDVVDIASGQVDPRVEPYASMPHVGSDNIRSGTGELFGIQRARDLALISGKYTFDASDVLYSKIRPALNKVALPAVAGVCSADIYPIRCRPNLDRRFLAHLLRCSEFLEFARKHSARTNIPKMNRKALLEYQFEIPALAEQRRIADLLDKADAIRRKRKEALALTDDLLRSTFLEMFGDPVTNPKGWPVAKLGSLLNFLTSGSRGWARFYTDSGATFLRIQNVKRDELALDDVAFVNPPETAEAKRTRVKPGDVLLSITADLGRTAVVPDDLTDAHINQHLAILRPAGIDPEFLSAYLASPGGQMQFTRLNRHGVKAGLNFNDIRGVDVMLPSANAQATYATAKRKIRRARVDYVQTLQESERLFGSLMDRAFRGELTAAQPGERARRTG